MDASRALRPLAATAAAAVLLTGAACNGPLARRAARQQTPATSVTTFAPAPAGPPPTSVPASPGQAVRTDDLDAGLQQADSQMSQTSGAVGDADQNPQQNND
jgi:hypothetical protein